MPEMKEIQAMQEIATLLLNNGIAVVIIAYFIYRDNKFMATLQNTLTTLVDTVKALEDLIHDKI